MSQSIKLLLTVNSVIDNLGDSGLPEGDPEINIFTTEGEISPYADGLLLCFTESGEGGTARSDIYLAGNSVRLVKSGDITSEMLFREGEKFDTVYSVGPYSFDMTVLTKRIRGTLTEDGGELQIIYSMNIGGQSKNVRMKISAKRK